MKKPKILGIILARGGSKGIPRKNIYPCAGKPLIWYTFEAAKRSSLIDRLILSTDDEEIAEIGRKNNIEVPFIRPKELAGDTTPDIPVFLHALDEFEKKGEKFDIIVQLRPTSPVRRVADIEKGIELLISNPNVDSVRSVCEPAHTPFKMYRIKDNGNLGPLLGNEYKETFKKYPETFNISRQLLPKVWQHFGYLDIMRVSYLKEKRTSFGRHLPLFIENWRNLDIDSLDELLLAEKIIKKLRKEKKDIFS